MRCGRSRWEIAATALVAWAAAGAGRGSGGAPSISPGGCAHHVPPLVTTSPDGTPVGDAGVLPNATILFGDQQINDKARSGGRFTVGYWFDDCQTLGIENTFFFIGGSNDGYTASSSGSPILARPFFNTDTQENDSILLAYPQVVAGGINISSSRTIFSNEVNLRRGLYADCCRRVDILAGYRYMRLGETLDIATNSTDLQSSESGAQFVAQDRFSTNNNFNGGQLGLNLQYTYGCWTWGSAGQGGLGRRCPTGAHQWFDHHHAGRQSQYVQWRNSGSPLEHRPARPNGVRCVARVRHQLAATSGRRCGV